MHTGVQIPIGAEDRFEGVVDLVRMKGITWDGEVGPFLQTLFTFMFVCSSCKNVYQKQFTRPMVATVRNSYDLTLTTT